MHVGVHSSQKYKLDFFLQNVVNIVPFTLIAVSKIKVVLLLYLNQISTYLDKSMKKIKRSVSLNKNILRQFAKTGEIKQNPVSQYPNIVEKFHFLKLTFLN